MAVQSSFDSSCISNAGQEGTTLSQEALNLPTYLLQTQCFAKQLLPALLGCPALGMWKPDRCPTPCLRLPVRHVKCWWGLGRGW